MKKLAWITLSLVAAACGDDNPGTQDAPVTVDSPDVDAAIDAPMFTPPMAHSLQLSAAGPDIIMAATAGPDGGFYAAGWMAADTTAGTPRHVIVVKLLPTGMPDTTFGVAGVANTMVPFRGANDEIDIALQSDGKIILSATVAAAVVNPTDASDTDIALIRLTTAGALDTTFGGTGVVVHSLNTSYTDTAARGRDAVRALAIGPNDTIFIHGIQRGEGNVTGGATPRIDTDYVVVKFTALGVLDLTYGGGDGKYLLDLYIGVTAPAHSDATARGLSVLADGSAVAGGYSRGTLTTNPQVVMYKLTPAGALDTAFATGGIHHEVILDVMTEAYNFSRHGDNVVTGGYGRNAGAINDWVSLRFNINTGVRDLTWGGAADGVVLFDPDPSDTTMTSNCRNTIALPNGKTLLVGSTGTGSPEQDAIWAVLDASGQLDTTFGTGIAKYALGSNGADAFWGGAVNGNTALIVGFKGATDSMAQTASDNDDAYAVLLTLP